MSRFGNWIPGRHTDKKSVALILICSFIFVQRFSELKPLMPAMIYNISQLLLIVGSIFVLGSYVEASWRRWTSSAKQLRDKCIVTGTLGMTFLVITRWVGYYYTKLLINGYSHLMSHLHTLRTQAMHIELSLWLEKQVSVTAVGVTCIILLVLKRMLNLPGAII